MTFVRYIAVQVAAYALDMGGFLLLHAMGAHPLAANLFGKAAAGSFAFAAHRYVTFDRARDAAAGSQAIRYFTLLALNIPLSSAVLAGVLYLWAWPPGAKFVSDVICVALTYWLSKRYVFRPRAQP